MRSLTTVALIFLVSMGLCAQNDDLVTKLKESHFHAQLDLQTKYIWRGMEMITEESAPVVFPQINYQSKGLYAYIMGGYSINGKYAEVDFGVSYTQKWLTISLNDYYYPTTDTPYDSYFDIKSHSTGHWLEGIITIAPEKIPVYVTLSNFFAGADKNLNGKQAYSTYAEIGGHYDFLNNNSISLAVGTALNKSCYNAYEHNLGICNIEMKYSHTIHFKNDWTLPVTVAYIANPIFEKSFINCTMSFGF